MYPMPMTAQVDSSAQPINQSQLIPTAPQDSSAMMQSQNAGATEAQKLIDGFGNIFQQLKQLAMAYPNATEEFSAVTESLKSWLAKASDSIVSGGEGNSATY